LNGIQKAKDIFPYVEKAETKELERRRENCLFFFMIFSF